jgi:hypothetical protein
MGKVIVLARIHLDKNRFKTFYEESGLKNKFRGFEFVFTLQQLEKKFKEEEPGEVVIGCMFLERLAQEGETVNTVADIKKVLGKHIPLICYKKQADPLRLLRINEIEDSPTSVGINFYE